MPENAQTTAQGHSFHMLERLYPKSSYVPYYTHYLILRITLVEKAEEP